MAHIKPPTIPRPVNAFGLNEEGTVGSIEEYADLTAATMVQQMTIAGDDDDNSIEEYIKQACIYGAHWQQEQDGKTYDLGVDVGRKLGVAEGKTKMIDEACVAYCAVCDTKECGGTGECGWVAKFRKQLAKHVLVENASTGFSGSLIPTEPATDGLIKTEE